LEQAASQFGRGVKKAKLFRRKYALLLTMTKAMTKSGTHRNGMKRGG
jgi:hypothetical protein